MAKVIVATRETQGHRPDDFYFADEGELLSLGFQCETGGEECGCWRSWIGMNTLKGTTTAKVVEMDVDLPAEIRASFINRGMTSEEADEQMDMCRKIAEDIELSIMPFDIGDVIGRTNLGVFKRDGTSDETIPALVYRRMKRTGRLLLNLFWGEIAAILLAILLICFGK